MIVYNDLQLAVKPPLDVHLKVRHVLTHFLYFQQKMHNYKITESNHLRVSFAKTRTSSWTQPLLGASFSLDITHAALVMFKSNICVILAAVVVRPQWLSAVSCKLDDTLWWRDSVTQMPASKFAVFWSDFFSFMLSEETVAHHFLTQPTLFALDQNYCQILRFGKFAFIISFLLHTFLLVSSPNCQSLWAHSSQVLHWFTVPVKSARLSLLHIQVMQVYC